MSISFVSAFVWLYGAAGHGKGLIDAMSSFGVKAILRRDAWFANRDELCNHLRMRGDTRMSCDVVNPEQVNRKRMEKVPFVIKDCTRMHLFDYRPNNKTVFCREFLCDCVSCLDFDFDQCLKENDNVQIIQDEEEVDESYFLDYENIDEGMKVYEFVEIPSYVALIAYNKIEPIYIIQVTEKGIAKNKMQDHYGNEIFTGEFYFKGNYLKFEPSRSRTKQYFSVIQGDALCDPSEVLEVFLDIGEDLTMNKDAYLS